MSEFANILNRAKRGEAQAQCEVGWAYATGEGVKKSFRCAADWYVKAAKQGHVIAQYNLSLSYLLGEGVRKSLRKAFKWNLPAAASGYEDAELALGWFYHGGRGVKEDWEIAKAWYLKASRKENPSAFFSLGQMAYDQCNFKEAIRWFSKGVKVYHPRSCYYLGEMLLYGKGVSVDPFRAKRYLKIAANAGNGYAKRLLNGKTLKNRLAGELNVAVNRWREGALIPTI